jgi:hypothetical protein
VHQKPERVNSRTPNISAIVHRRAERGEPSAAEASLPDSRRQASLALAAKRVSQRDLLPFGVAEDVRAQLTGETVVMQKICFRPAMARQQVVSGDKLNRAFRRCSRFFIVHSGNAAGAQR